MKRKKLITIQPVLDPAYNAREIIKELALLEDHLNAADRRCRDCCSKHFLKIEALAEEAVSLETPKKTCPCLLKTMAPKIRAMQHAWALARTNERVIRKISAGLRHLRKKLMRTCSTLPLAKLPTEQQRMVQEFLTGKKNRSPLKRIHAASLRANSKRR